MRKKKITTLIAACITTLFVSVIAFGESETTYYHFFDNTATISQNNVKSTKNIKSSMETHQLQLHPIKVDKSGNIYAMRSKKGAFGVWSITREYKFFINSTKYYRSDISSKLKGTYYYQLRSYNQDGINSGANVTFNQGFVKEVAE